MIIQVVARFFAWLLAFLAGLFAGFAAIMKHLRWIPVAVALGLVPVMQSANAQGIPNNVWLVDGDSGNDSNDGQGSWADARKTIQSVLTDINLASGDQIWVAASATPYTPGTAQGDSFDLVNGVWLLGGFAGNETNRNDANPYANETILDGDNTAYHVVTASDELTNNTVFTRLDGFIIEGGVAGGDTGNPRGGGLLVYADEAGNHWLKVSRCRFRDNSASRGGAVSVRRDPATSIVYNVELTNCEFTGNSAQNGGAVWTFGGIITINNSLFVGNEATSKGGAIALAQTCTNNPTNCGVRDCIGHQESDVTINNCTITENTAEDELGIRGVRDIGVRDDGVRDSHLLNDGDWQVSEACDKEELSGGDESIANHLEGTEIGDLLDELMEEEDEEAAAELAAQLLELLSE